MRDDNQVEQSVIANSTANELFKSLYAGQDRAVATTIITVDGKSKRLMPEGYPHSAGGLEKPWNYEQSLHYSKEWQEKGGYKLLPLTTTVSKLDTSFVKSLCKVIDSGYEIEEITLLSDIGDEQAFIAQLDLLEKKDDREKKGFENVHNAKWKPKNHKDTPETVQAEFRARKEVREQLKSIRYRSKSAPHVKLLPLWHGINLEQIKNLCGAGFDDLSYTEDGELGKGYYGTSDALAAYETAQQKDKANNQTLLVLSWYAGKVVYPTLSTDCDLKGQPHYANHDLHYRYHAGRHTAVVFEPGQILPRYLVSIKKLGVPSGIMAKVLDLPAADTNKSSLLLQNNFSHVINKLGQNSLAKVETWLLSQTQLTPTSTVATCLHENLLQDFLKNSKLEVLLLKTADSQDSQLLAQALAAKLWNEHQAGEPIILPIDLKEFNNKDNLIAQALLKEGIVTDAIEDLRQQQKFNLIISGYDQYNKLSLKGNYFNRPGGFCGKVIVILPTAELVDSEEDWVLYTEGGSFEQQKSRLISHKLPKLTAEQTTSQLAYIAHIVATKSILLPQQAYTAASPFLSFTNAHNLLPTPGGELKPWEYNNELKYSPNWQDKGAFKLHQTTPGTPDYDFVQKLYQETAMPGYELDEVYVIADRGAEQAFVANLNNLTRQANVEANFLDRADERKHLMNHLEQQSYQTSLAAKIKLLPLWHGTGPAAAAGIAKSGFASLALVDAGYFGKGLYGSDRAEYSYKTYAKRFHGEDGLLIVGWYAGQNIYPCFPEDKKQLEGKANYKNYDSHYAKIARNTYEFTFCSNLLPSNLERDVLYLLKYGDKCKYAIIDPAGNRVEDELDVKLTKELTKEQIKDILKITTARGHTKQQDTYEYVTFATAQVLPRYIVSLKTKGSMVSLPGMQKFLNTPIATPITQNLYQDDLEQAIAKLQESAKNEREEDFILSQGLSLYIPSLGADNDQIDNVPEEKQHALLTKSIEFLTHPKQELWLIQGNAGSGKSLFGRYLERELWDRYEDGHLIPLFIPLPRLGDLGEDLIAKALQLKGLTTKSILELKKTKKFLFILDGYDEIPGKPKLLQQYNFNEPNNWQGKIIVGSRLQYLTAQEENLLLPNHPNETLTQSIERSTKSYIIPFKQEQIDNYIEGFCNSKFNENNDGSRKWPIDQYQQKITEFKGIAEFLKEPFLLFLVLSVLPDLSEKFSSSRIGTIPKVLKKDNEAELKDNEAELLVKFISSAEEIAAPSVIIKKIDLYDAFTEGWFNSQFDRMVKYARKELSHYTKQSLLEKFNNCAKNLAFTMFLADTQVIRHNAQGEVDSIFNKFFADEEAKLAFQGSPLKKIGESYLFIHKSFQEYFVASKVLQELESSSTSSLEQKLMTEAPAILNFIAQKLPNSILQRTPLTEKLFNIILNSRHPGDSFSIAAANAATILNVARIAFSTRDLSGIRIPGADLTGAILDHTNLENADLKNVKLKEAWLQGANLKNADLTGAIFGELAYKQLDRTVNECKYSPDGKYFAATTGSKTTIYQVEETGSLTEIDSPDPSAYGFQANSATSPDGQYSATIKDENNIELYKIDESGNRILVNTLTGHTNSVNSVTFSPDNQWLASGSVDNTVRLWSLSDPTKTHTLTGHTDSVRSVTFSPDNQWLASGSRDETVRFWSLSDPTKTHTLTGHTNSVNSITFSPDNQWLASGSSDKTVRLWSLSDPTKTHTLTGHTGSVLSVTFSPDNQWLASGSYDKTVRLWSLIDPTKTHTLGHTSFVNSVTFSPDNKWLASGSDDNTVRLWSLSDPTKTHTLTDHTNWVRSVTFSPDNQWLASGSYDKTVRLWSLIDPTKTHTLTGHTSTVNSVTFSPDNQWLASASKDNSIIIWSIKSDGHDICVEQAFSCTTNFKIYSLSYTTIDSRLFLSTGGSDCSVRVYEQHAGKLIFIYKIPQNQLYPLQADLTFATLSSTNAELLLQRGATGEPKISELSDETELASDKLPLLEQTMSIFCENQPILNLTVNQKLQNLSVKLFPQSLPTQQLLINLTKQKSSFERLIDFIIDKQGNLNETEQDQITLLMMASALQDYEATKKLIIAGADKDKTDGHATALHYLCAYGSPQILTLLLEQGCSLDMPDSTGDYPELWAVKKDNIEALKILLEFKINGTQAIDINRIQGSTDKNLLDTAKHYNATECIAYLNQLEEQQISEKISNLYLEPEAVIRSTTPILFSPSLQPQHPPILTVEILLNNVAYGKQQEAETILLQNRQLALLPGNVTDCAGRSFAQITALQYAVWALDYHMWTMILQHIPESAINQQLSALANNNWPVHGTQISWQNLITALQQYISNYNQYSILERTKYWTQTIGGAQLLLPAHVINEYSNPEQSFARYYNYLEPSNILTTRTGVDNWRRISSNYGYILGENFAWIRGDNCSRLGVSLAINLEAAMDLTAITALLEAREAQAEQLISSYSVTSKMSKLQIS